MRLFENFIENEMDKIIEKKVSIKFIGKKEMFSNKLQGLMGKVEEKSKGFNTILYMAMSYGGRLEIVEGVKNFPKKKLKKKLSL